MKLSLNSSPLNNDQGGSVRTSTVTHAGDSGGRGIFTATSTSMRPKTVVSSTTATPGRRRRQIGPMQVSARFLPYDDVCDAMYLRNGTNDDNIAEEEVLEYKPLDFDFTGALNGNHLQHVPRDNAIDLLTPSALCSSTDFFSELHCALNHAFDDSSDEPKSPNSPESKEQGSTRWMNMFQVWPLELAASGYAEWWLRHPQCCVDASSVFEHIIQGLVKEERHRNVVERNFHDKTPNSSGTLEGALTMLQAIYAYPPRSLAAMFKRPLHHQRLFFLSCRLGIYERQSCSGEKENVRVLALSFSLAAAIVPYIEGSQLAMRHDLIRFLGNVQREWISLLELRPNEETLRKEFDGVQSVLATAQD